MAPQHPNESPTNAPASRSSSAILQAVLACLVATLVILAFLVAPILLLAAVGLAVYGIEQLSSARRTPRETPQPEDA